MVNSEVPIRYVYVCIWIWAKLFKLYILFFATKSYFPTLCAHVEAILLCGKLTFLRLRCFFLRIATVSLHEFYALPQTLLSIAIFSLCWTNMLVLSWLCKAFSLSLWFKSLELAWQKSTRAITFYCGANLQFS